MKRIITSVVRLPLIGKADQTIIAKPQEVVTVDGNKAYFKGRQVCLKVVKKHSLREGDSRVEDLTAPPAWPSDS